MRFLLTFEPSSAGPGMSGTRIIFKSKCENHITTKLKHIGQCCGPESEAGPGPGMSGTKFEEQVRKQYGEQRLIRQPVLGSRELPDVDLNFTTGMALQVGQRQDDTLSFRDVWAFLPWRRLVWNNNYKNKCENDVFDSSTGARFQGARQDLVQACLEQVFLSLREFRRPYLNKIWGSDLCGFVKPQK